MSHHKKKGLRTLKICLIISLFLVLGSSQGANPFGLVDTSIYESTTNTLSSNEHNFEIFTENAKAQDADGKDITQYMTFTWNGMAPLNTDWLFVYSQPLESGKVDAWLTYDKPIIEYYYYNATGSMTVYDVTGFVPSLDPCNYGNQWNEYKYRANTANSSYVYCFNSYVQDGDDYTLTGNYTRMGERQVLKSVTEWVDITDSFSFLGSDLLGHNFQYYYIKDVSFDPGDSYRTRWTYTPYNRARSGKWYVFGKPHDLSLQQAISSGQYIFQDPWWNAEWDYYILYNITAHANITDYPWFAEINFSDYLGGGEKLSNTSIRVLETDDSLSTYDEIPYHFFAGKNVSINNTMAYPSNEYIYNNETNAYGTLSWTVNGTLGNGSTRYYAIYFHIKYKDPPSYSGLDTESDATFYIIDSGAMDFGVKKTRGTGYLRADNISVFQAPIVDGDVDNIGDHIDDNGALNNKNQDSSALSVSCDWQLNDSQIGQINCTSWDCFGSTNKVYCHLNVSCFYGAGCFINWKTHYTANTASSGSNYWSELLSSGDLCGAADDCITETTDKHLIADNNWVESEKLRSGVPSYSTAFAKYVAYWETAVGDAGNGNNGMSYVNFRLDDTTTSLIGTLKPNEAVPETAGKSTYKDIYAYWLHDSRPFQTNATLTFRQMARSLLVGPPTVTYSSSAYTLDITPPTITWNWADQNTTTSYNSTTIGVTLSETGNCTLHFNGTEYPNTTSGTSITWNFTNMPNGNYSVINVTCDDSSNNEANSTNSWWDVSVRQALVNTSIEHFDFDVDNVIFDTPTYAQIANISFNTTVISDLIIRGSLNVQKNSLPQASTVWMKLTLNNVVHFDVPLRTVQTTSDIGSVTTPHVIATSTLNNNNLTIEVRETGMGSVNISNFVLHILTNMTNAGESFRTNLTKDNHTFSNTSFEPTFRWSIPKLITSTTIIDIYHLVSATGATVTTCFLNDTNQSPSYSRGVSSATDIGSSGTEFISNVPTSVPTDWTLTCRNSNAETVTNNITILDFDLSDRTGNNITNFQTTNTSTNITSPQTFSAGINQLAKVEQFKIYDGNEIEVTVALSAQPLSGIQTLSSFVTISNSTFSENSSIIERYFSGNTDVGLVKYYHSYLNITTDSPYNLTLYIEVEAGETINISDESFSGLAAVSLNISEGNVAPLPNSITSPEEGDTVAGIINVTWLAFSDPNNNFADYNITLSNSTDTTVINGSTTDLFVLLNTSSFSDGNYNLTVEGCDAAGLCSSTTIEITIANDVLENTSLVINCPESVFINEVFTIWADYENSTEDDVLNAEVNITNATETTNMSYSAANSRYELDFSSGTFPFTWRINITANATGYSNKSASCEVRIINMFQVSVRIWEEVEREVFARTNETIITVKNYDVELIDPYINVFGYVFLVNLDRNDSTLYEDCNVPFASGEKALDWLNLGNFWGDNLTSTMTNIYGSIVWCDKAWYRGQYINGEANISIPYTGNYSIFFVSGTLTFENNVSPPGIVHGGISIPFGFVNFNDSAVNYEIDLYVPHSELDFWGALSDGFYIFFAAIFPLMLFVVLLLMGVGVTKAIGFALAMPLLITFLRMTGII